MPSLREKWCSAWRASGNAVLSEIATCSFTRVIGPIGMFMFQEPTSIRLAAAREAGAGGADPSQCARSIYFAHRGED